MISINKPKKVPDNLIEIQNLVAEQLYSKRNKFKWETSHYSAPIKEDLKTLYNNKCGFCEVILTEEDTENKFTVEHFRPKSVYYWLGVEWTNLFPTCKACNGNKENDFPLFSIQNKFKLENVPFDENGFLIKEKCKADCDDLLNEKPLFIHPEITKPEKYFKFEPSGKIVVNKEILNTYEIEQARKMVDKFLKRPSVEEKRKKKIIYYQNRLTNLLIKAIEELGKNYTVRDIKLTFLDFFSDIICQKEIEAEFSLLGFYMIKDFDKFFLDKIENEYGKDLRNLAEFAYNQFIQK